MLELLSFARELSQAVLIGAGPIPLAIHLTRLESGPLRHRLLVVLVAWCGIQTSLGLCLGALGLLTGAVVMTAEAVLAGAGLMLLRGRAKPGLESEDGTVGEPEQAVPGRIAAFLFASLSALGLVLTWQLLATQIHDYDTFAFHLPTMALWYQTGSLAILDQFELIVGRYPYGWELIGTLFIFPFRGDFAAALPNIVSWLILGLAVAGLAREAGAPEAHAAAGACAVLTLPITLDGLYSLHVDLPCAAFFIAALYLVLHGGGTRSREGLALAALAVGLLLGTKVSGIGYGGVVMAIGLIELWCGRRGQTGSSFRSAPGDRVAVTVLSAMALLVGLFWYLRNLLECGSPLGKIGIRLGPMELFPGAIHASQLIETALASQFGFDRLQDWLILVDQLWVRLGLPGALLVLLGLAFPVSVAAKGRVRQRLILGLTLAVTIVFYWFTPFTAANSLVRGITPWVGGQFRLGMPAVGLLGVAAALGSTVLRLPATVAAGAVAALCGLAAARRGIFLPTALLSAVVLVALWLAFRPAVTANLRRWTGRPLATGFGSLVLVAVVVVCSFQARIRHDRARHERFGRLDDFLARELAAGEPVGYMLGQRVYPLFGPKLDRRVVWVQAGNPSLEQWLTGIRGERHFDQSDDLDVDHWLAKLDADRVRMIAVGPIPAKWRKRHELGWLEDSRRPFELVFGRYPTKQMVVFAPASDPSHGGGGGEPGPEIDMEQQRRLEALGYLATVPVGEDDRNASGVTRYVRGFAHEGLNLFNLRAQAVARLVDMEGREVHRWRSTERGTTMVRFKTMLPSFMPAYLRGWNHFELQENGDLVVIATHHMLLRLDWHSRVVWKLDLSAHHDLAVADNGDILVLADGVRTTEVDGRMVAFQDNFVVVVSPAGRIGRRQSLFDAFVGTPWEPEIGRSLAAIEAQIPSRIDHYRQAANAREEDRAEAARIYRAATRGDFGDVEDIANVLFHLHAEDIFHSNSIQILARDNPGLWRRGDLLISLLKLDRLVVIDHQTEKVIWAWGEGELEGQHHATWLDSGEILLFDNGDRRKHSRLVKLDPLSREIVWQYRASPPDSFYSATRGGCQQLGNGNVLIAETDRGRSFEVTPTGEIVWEFYSEVVGETASGERRGAICRMTRIDPASVEPLLPSR